MTKTLATIGFLFAGLIAAMADDTEEVKEAIARFKKGMSNPSPAARAAAATDLSHTPSDKTAALLGGLLGSEADTVKMAAAEGLGNYKDFKKVATPTLLVGLNANAKEPKVQEAIFKGLGKLGDESSLSTIHNYFDDKDSVVANAAIMAAAEIRSPSSMDPLIALMKKYEKIEENAKKGGGGGYGGVNVPYAGDDPKNKLAKDVLPTIIKACQKICNEKWASTKEWEIWWNKNKATFKGAK